MTRIRILTLNIFGGAENWGARRRILVDGLRRLQPDLVALQETMLIGTYQQAEDILGHDFHVINSRVREADGGGSSIGSRWPISSVRELDFKSVSPRTGAFACTALHAGIDAPAPIGPVLFVSHFPDYQVDHEFERERQTVLLARTIETLVSDSRMHVVLAGDMFATCAVAR